MEKSKQATEKRAPVRSTKLAYVDHVVKPPRNILKQQAKYGTANEVPVKPVSDIKKKLITSCLGGLGGSSSSSGVPVPIPLGVRARQTSEYRIVKSFSLMIKKILNSFSPLFSQQPKEE